MNILYTIAFIFPFSWAQTEKNIHCTGSLEFMFMFTRYVVLVGIFFFIKQRFHLTLNLYYPGTLKCGHDSSGGWETLFDAKNKKDLALFQCSASLCTFDTPLTLEISFQNNIFIQNQINDYCNHFLSSWLMVMPRMVWIEL